MSRVSDYAKKVTISFDAMRARELEITKRWDKYAGDEIQRKRSWPEELHGNALSALGTL